MVSNMPTPTAASHSTNDAPTSSGAATVRTLFAVTPEGGWVGEPIGAFHHKSVLLRASITYSVPAIAGRAIGPREEYGSS